MGRGAGCFVIEVTEGGRMEGGVVVVVERAEGNKRISAALRCSPGVIKG